MSEVRTIATIGEILVEFVSHRRNCALEQIAEYSGPYPSGAPAIFIDQAARMGARTKMVGGLGADGFGRSVLARLKADGVGIDGVTLSRTRSTGVAFVSYYDDGERDFIFHLAGTAADDFEVPLAVTSLKDTVLHVSASSLGPASMRRKILDAVDAVIDAGGSVTCDPNARPELMNDEAARDAIFEVMARSYCLIPSTSDLSFLYPDLSEENAVDQLLNSGAEVVAVKQGSRGATVAGQDERYHFQGHRVDELDPTGAGDCFCGTFIALLVQGASLYDAGRQANAAGAIAVTRRGPMEGNSGPAEIANLLASSVPGERTA